VNSIQNVFHSDALDDSLERNFAAPVAIDSLIPPDDVGMGYLLHSSIPREPGMRIVDDATGTGISLLSLADELPEDYVLEGWDISDSQFLPKNILPINIAFGMLDAIDEFLC
jgi:hypothetical protein